MPQKRKQVKAAKAKNKETRAKKRSKAPAARAALRVWTGTGLCPEAQGDGVPCRGVDGECAVCGRALPPPEASA